MGEVFPELGGDADLEVCCCTSESAGEVASSPVAWAFLNICSSEYSVPGLLLVGRIP
jgi:hypothetical protein